MLSVLSALLLLLAPAPSGAPRAYNIDRDHSQILFNAEARFISAHGAFDKWTAEVLFDPDTIVNSSVKITIETASLNTKSDRRDNHLRSPDFFDAATYPTITFVSRKVASAGENMYNITGDLTLRGVTKEVVVPMTLVFYEKGRGRFKGGFSLNRKDYGINYDSMVNSIQNKVDIVIEMGIRAPQGG